MFPLNMTSTANTTPRRRRHALALPNILTYGRLVAVPVVAALLQWPQEHWMRWTALAVFTAAGVTDFFDGYLARVWAQQSSLGQMLDPIADKLLVSATLMLCVADQTISGWTTWAALIILCREILVSGLREYLADLKVPVPVSAIAKWKTTLQLVALGFFIAGPAGEVVLPGTVEIGNVLLWVAAVLTLYTGFDYMRASWAHFGDVD
jgi:cardiolipin synthase